MVTSFPRFEKGVVTQEFSQFVTDIACLTSTMPRCQVSDLVVDNLMSKDGIWTSLVTVVS